MDDQTDNPETASSDEISATYGEGVRNSPVGKHINQTNIENQTNIQNFAIFGQFLEFVQIEEILPQVDEGEILKDVSAVIEDTFGLANRKNLTETMAFVAKILYDVLAEPIPQDSSQLIDLKPIMNSLVKHMGKTLDETGHWKKYFKDVGPDKEALALKSTNIFWKKYFKDSRDFHIVKALSTSVFFEGQYFYKLHVSEPLDEGNAGLQVAIAGMVVDLIRIYTDKFTSAGLLPKMAKLLTSVSNE